MPGTALVHRLPFFVLLFCFHDVSVLSLFIVECAARMSMRWRREMQCTTVHGLIVQIARFCSTARMPAVARMSAVSCFASDGLSQVDGAELVVCLPILAV